MTATVNANFHPVGRSVFEARSQDDAYREYRRQWVENPTTFTVSPAPLHVDFESTGVCNLRCPFCGTTQRSWGPTAPGYMPLDTYKALVDEASAIGVYAAKLSFRGEPLIHPKIVEMVRYAKDKGLLDVYFNTNGLLLTREMSQQLMDAGLDRISFSIEGTTAEVYERHRVGSHFDRVRENVEYLFRLRASRHSTRPQIRIQMVGLPELMKDYAAYVAFWQPWADEVAYIDARQEGPGVNHRGQVSEWACPFLWQRLTVLWDGTMLPCCLHGVSDFNLLTIGKFPDLSLKVAWTSEMSRRVRELHEVGCAHVIAACDQCSFRAAELAKRTEGASP